LRWRKPSAGRPSAYGVSWQIVPTVLPELLGDPDPEKSQRVMQAMLKMK
jgi:predicted 3-demethylubiquinone-9 3-methyltransferase (glyoxalase superfamily)